jgi:glycosyltransferase involved in cell wall biosynthesis
MKILFITLVRITSLEEHSLYMDLINEFWKQGNEVTVLSTSERRYNEESSILTKPKLKVCRVKCPNIIQNSNEFSKGMATFLIPFSLIRYSKKMLREQEFDAIITTTPIVTFVHVVNYFCNRQKKRPTTYLLLKDMWPYGMIPQRFCFLYFSKMIFCLILLLNAKSLYKNSDNIGCMSKQNVSFLLSKEKKLNSQKVHVCPNAITPTDYQKIVKNDEIFDRLGIKRNSLKLIYGGSIGYPQDVKYIIKCLKRMENENGVDFIIIGKGTDFPKLEKAFPRNSNSNVHIFSFLPNKDYIQILRNCDVGLIFLGYNSDLPRFPSRMLAYMELSIPIIAATSNCTDIGEIIENNGFGLKVSSNSVMDFVFAVRKISTMDYKKMGNRGRIFLENNYTTEKVYNIIMHKLLQKN